jgi:hypothetical protein
MVSTLLIAREPMETASAPVAELVGLATCPLCHTQDLSTTNRAVGTGAGWQCSRCGSRWDAVRLGNVAAYNTWVSEQTATPVSPVLPDRLIV